MNPITEIKNHIQTLENELSDAKQKIKAMDVFLETLKKDIQLLQAGYELGKNENISR